jgi:hypothetical protein
MESRWSVKVNGTCLMQATSQSLTEVSFDPVAIDLPSGEKTAVFTTPPCPWSEPWTTPVRASKMRAEKEYGQVDTMRLPSGE